MATEWSPPSVMQMRPEATTLATEAASAALKPSTAAKFLAPRMPPPSAKMVSAAVGDRSP